MCMDLLKKTSLIITTCPGRDQYVSRILGYYRSVAPELPIILVGEESQDLSQFTRQSKQNIVSILASAHTNLYQKVAVALNDVSSDIVAVCADDDLLEITALKDAVKHLMSNPKVVAVKGHCVSFCQICGGFWVKSNRDQSIVGQTALSRLVQQSAAGGQLIYMASRCEAAIASYQAATEGINYSRYSEQILAHVFPMIGQIVCLDQPFNIRQWDAGSEGNAIVRFSKYYLSQAHCAETKQFKNIVLRCMQDYDVLNGSEVGEYNALFENVFDRLLYYRHVYSDQLKQNTRSSVMRWVRDYLIKLPSYQRRSFQKSVKQHFVPIETTPYSTLPIFSYLQKA